ncbi:hypothetical protein EMGBD4_16920 [Verrucomicrobiota bacterium]|nr:hypothetical protein EMGBD4_16920 [Verrucomicrobiota bacterium]
MTDNNYYDSSPITPPASMVCTYQLYLLNRHLFVDLPEGRALVDTGAPYSASTTVV